VRSAAGRSPLYDSLWRRLADETFVDELVEGGYRWDTPLRLVGGLHFLVLGGDASWDDIDGALRAHAAFLRRFVAEQGVQTNEVQRSWMLLPCFLEASRRTDVETIDVIELGPSAGLNLIWDRYRYAYDLGRWGRPDSPLLLSGEERGRVPASLLARRPRVRGRVGIDRSPIDVTTEEGARLLKAFVWPDQVWRLELIDHAIAALREKPPELVRGDVVDELPRRLRARRDDALTLVFQTAVLGYVGHEGTQRLYAALDAAAADRAPLAYVGTHAPGPDVHTHYALALRVWPGEREFVAEADFHGAWLDWRL
jgi:hypothetical protein